MKFTINQSDLVGPLRKLASISPGPQTIGATSDILIEPSADGVSFTATDNNLRLAFNLSVTGEDLSTCTVPAAKLLSICSKFGEGESIDFEHDAENNQMKFQCGSSRYKVTTRNPDEFPSMEARTDEHSIEISEADLLKLLTPVKYAAASNDMRYYLMGVLLEVAPDKLSAAATDGHRMAVTECELSTGVTETRQIILPSKSVDELTKILVDEEEKVTLRLAGNHLKVDMGGRRDGFETILVDGKYPDYRAVIPSDRPISATVNRRLLLRATERLDAVSDESLKGVKITLGEVLTVQCHNNVGDVGEEVFDGVGHDGEKVEITLNINYLIDALGNMKDDNVVLCLKDETSSLLLNSGATEDGRHIIMPMRN